ncbi:MAG: extracellular solute-binding protein [Chloroflexi bacterium]|nr:extracellular solute-binding protein [Chloroflexota bacterium]
MNHKINVSGKLALVGLICSVAVLLSCAPAPAATPAPTVKAPGAGPGTAQKTGWQGDWDKTLAAAKTEGVVSISTSLASPTRVMIGQAFEEKFGLEVEWIPVPAAQVTPKLSRERQAGLYLVDFQVAALSRQLGELKPAGMLDPIKPLLVLPEVLDKKAWFGGDINWLDNDKAYIINNIASPERPMAVNTNLVNPGEIKSWKDLLDPRWKGKVATINPVTNSRIGVLMHKFGGPGYMEKLVAQNPIVVNDHRQGFEMVAQAKYPVMISTMASVFMEFKSAGAPVARVKLEEGGTLAGGQNSISLINRPPHPNAAKIFANWWLTKEFGAALSRNLNLQSARLDVPTDHLDPDNIRDPSVKYILVEEEEFQDFQREVRDTVSSKVWAPLLK